MTDSPDFLVQKFGITDSQIFVFTLPDFREIGSKKLADSKKSGVGLRHNSVVTLTVTLEFRYPIHAIGYCNPVFLIRPRMILYINLHEHCTDLIHTYM